MNSGYAHKPESWGRFIDCVAIHEKNKDVAIVLNRRGEFAKPTCEEFGETIFTLERLALLKAKGYGEVVLQEGDQKCVWSVAPEGEQQKRRLTVIVRPSFSQQDMRCLQLASERLLATGDNSAIEAWCSRCILYLYEDVSNCGCKWRFLQQQVDLAQGISPELGRLPALFGGDRRLPEGIKEGDNSAEIERLLNAPDLSAATLRMCEEITARYSFSEVLESALKRRAWHHLIPELTAMEAEALYDTEFGLGLVAYLKDPESVAGTALQPPPLAGLGHRVHTAVHRFLAAIKPPEKPA